MQPTDFLTREQVETYHAYRRDCESKMKDGTHLGQRVATFLAGRVKPAYAGVWECPYKDGPSDITHPSGRYLAQLMTGGIHPPIEAHWNATLLLLARDGRHATCAKIEAPRVRIDLGEITAEWVIDDRRALNEVAGPMSFEAAHEYVFFKDVPRYCWDGRSNQKRFSIVPLHQIPEDRRFRSAWQMKDAA